jgi:hypothetical protein
MAGGKFVSELTHKSQQTNPKFLLYEGILKLLMILIYFVLLLISHSLKICGNKPEFAPFSGLIPLSCFYFQSFSRLPKITASAMTLRNSATTLKIFGLLLVKENRIMAIIFALDKT